jgi:hypothetical protein
MEDRLNKLEQIIAEHINDHAKTDAKVDQLLIFAGKAQPVVDAWSGAGTLASIVRSLASVIVAIGAVWIGIQWVIKQALQ